MASINVNAANDGDQTIVGAPGAGLCIVVYNLILTGATTAGTAILKSGATTHGAFSLGTSGGVSLDGSVANPLFTCEPNQALVVNNSAGLDTKGMIVYGVKNA